MPFMNGYTNPIANAATVGSKPWRYLLVPHDEIKESDRLTAFLRFELKA